MGLTWHRLVLLGILLLAVGLRVHRLGAQSLWYDEAVTAQLVAQDIGALTRWTAEDIQPPLYYYAVAGWTRVAGRSEWALRFPSVFCGALTVPLLWALARRLFGQGRIGRSASLVVTGLAAISPLYVYYSQEARMYAQLTLLAALTGYALLRALNQRISESANQRISESANQRISESVNWQINQGARGEDGRSVALRWAVFVGVAVTLLYTHYFGAFLLLAYGICVVISQAPWGVSAVIHAARGATVEDRRHVPDTSQVPGTWRAMGQLRYFALASLAIVLCYLPWLPAMWTRYRVDRSYWQGSLKLGEALRHIAVSFTTGAPEMMLETQAARLLPWFGLALVSAVGTLVWVGWQRGRRAEEQGSRGAGESAGLRLISILVYLSTCLLLPLLFILVLASRTPKFNARYLMLVSPAYLLMLAGGLGALVAYTRTTWEHGVQWPLADRRSSHDVGIQGDAPRSTLHALRFTFHVSRLALFVILLVFLVVTSLHGLRNWFTDPAFTKAQWRELVAAVRAERTADEAVVLVSGHAWPAWDYYAPDIPRLRLPEIDILDVNAVLGFDAGKVLSAALAGKTGAWLVRWQAEAVDPVGFALFFLDRAGREQPSPGPFWHLDLHHWRLRPDATYPADPRPLHVQVANFDHKLALLGWDDPVDGQLTVYWRTLNLLQKDYKVSLILERADEPGRTYGRWDGRPAGYDYPTTRWQPGQTLFGVYPLPLPPRAAAGDYYVTLAVYDDADPDGLDIKDVADNPAAKRTPLGPMKLMAD